MARSFRGKGARDKGLVDVDMDGARVPAPPWTGEEEGLWAEHTGHLLGVALEAPRCPQVPMTPIPLAWGLRLHALLSFIFCRKGLKDKSEEWHEPPV